VHQQLISCASAVHIVRIYGAGGGCGCCSSWRDAVAHRQALGARIISGELLL